MRCMHSGLLQGGGRVCDLSSGVLLLDSGHSAHRMRRRLLLQGVRTVRPQRLPTRIHLPPRIRESNAVPGGESMHGIHVAGTHRHLLHGLLLSRDCGRRGGHPMLPWGNMPIHWHDSAAALHPRLCLSEIRSNSP